MAPTAATMTSTNTTINNNNISTLGAGSSGSTFATFGVYQQTPVGLSELSIRTLVPDNISAEPYHKVLITKILFRQILSLTDSPSVSFNNLMATVAAYFDINSGSTEREAESAAQSISRSCFHVSNLIGVIFSDSSGKPIKVPDTNNRPADITYFTFRSNVSANTIDCRAAKTSLVLEFSLRIPQTLSLSTLPSTATPLSIPTSSSVPAPTQPVEDLAFTLGNLSHDIPSGMEPDELLKLVINARDTITLSPSPPIQFIAQSNLLSTPQSLFPTAYSISLTPKIDRVQSIALSGDVMTFTGSLKFLDSQDSFDNVLVMNLPC